MKHGFPTASCVARLIERAACAARFQGKTGKGKLSTETLALILAHPGEPIFPETGVAGASCPIFAISHQSDLRSTKTPCSMQTRVEFPTAARGCVRVKRRTRAAVENSCTAVQHLTKALFLSKLVEPLLCPKARVITLVRRSKKRSVAAAGERTGAGTTGACGARAICPAAMRAFTSNSR